MVENLLIHIGLHKTGTTWLQKELFVSENDIFEPLSRTREGYSTLGKFFIEDKERYVLSPFDDNEANIRLEVQTNIAEKNASKSKIPVFSHERLSGNPHSGGFDAKSISRRLKKVFPKAKILIVIREQKSFILSNYFQYLSLGGTHSLKKYLNIEYDGRRPHFTPAYIEYTPLIKEYIKLFGRDQVLVLPYEMFRNQPLLFLNHISTFLKKEIVINENKFKVFRNKKNHQFFMFYFRVFNLLRYKNSLNNYSFIRNKIGSRIVKGMIKTLGTILPDKLNDSLISRQKKQITDFVGDRYVSSNQELSQLININLENYGYHQ